MTPLDFWSPRQFADLASSEFHVPGTVETSGHVGRPVADDCTALDMMEAARVTGQRRGRSVGLDPRRCRSFDDRGDGGMFMTPCWMRSISNAAMTYADVRPSPIWNLDLSRMMQ